MNLMDFKNNVSVTEHPKRLDDFIRYMETMRGSAKNTIDGYSTDLMLFFKFMKVRRGFISDKVEFKDIKVNDIDDDFIKEITLDDIHSFLIFSSKYLDNGNSTIARKIASMRALFKYMHTKLKIIPYDVTLDLDKPKIGKRKPKYMNLDEATNLLDSVSSRNPERDLLIITLFLNCGMRLAELCSINASDIKGDIIRIIGKGDKERLVYLNESCIDAIYKYLPIREDILNKRNTKQEALFVSERGTRVARRTVQGIVYSQINKAGLGGEGYSTHKLRHTAATMMYKHGGVDVLLLKEILGHEDVSTTQIYTHTDSDMLRDAVKVNPLNRKSKA